ncbi:hypothetical protein D082_01240 [Synechocystis sp. PCC 6714]|nr:hypothetical protein D082_01240 [Synechocystis sp. PCC 6714]
MAAHPLIFRIFCRHHPDPKLTIDIFLQLVECPLVLFRGSQGK